MSELTYYQAMQRIEKAISPMSPRIPLCYLRGELDAVAFRRELRDFEPIFDWRNTSEYPQKLHEWNSQFELGLDPRLIDDCAFPDHAGFFQPTGLNLRFGKGLAHDSKILGHVLEYELAKIGAPTWEGRCSLKNFVPSLAEGLALDGHPQLEAVLLDIIWNPVNGIDHRNWMRSQNHQPGLEVGWLMAMNAPIFATLAMGDIPNLMAPGLHLTQASDAPLTFHAAMFGTHTTFREYYDWGGKMKEYAVVSYREY